MTAAESKNKLVRNLTEEQLIAFLDDLLKTKNVTGAYIREQAQDRFNIEIGHNSANEFRREVFGGYIEKMRRVKEMSAAVAEHRPANGINTLADAASDLLQQQVFEFMVEADLDLNNPKDMEKAEQLSRIIKSARAEDRRMIDQLEKQVKELEAREQEAKETLTKKGLSDEDRAVAMRRMFGV